MLLDPAPDLAGTGRLDHHTPLGTDGLKLRRTFDTGALAAAFPFTRPDLPVTPAARPTTRGAVRGEPRQAGLVWWDRLAQDNHNSVVLARSGAGKSYFTKLGALRNPYQGRLLVSDGPRGRVRGVAEAAAAPTPLGQRDEGEPPGPARPPQAPGRPDMLARRGLFLDTLSPS